VTGTVRQFLGIPYAAPPVGSLRWRPPKAHAPWFVLRDATRFGNHCPQVAKVFGTASFSENCLFLNIFTPLDEENQQSGSRGYPVMVWIHGGALTVGENKMVRYWTEFAKSGDPNLSGVPFWHRYNATSDEFLSLVPPSPVPEFEFATDHKCDFWDTLLRSNTKGAARVSK